MKKIAQPKIITTSLENFKDEFYGIKGTDSRDEYELELAMEIIGDKIKELRKKQNLTQAELGALVGVQKAHISKVEAATNNATLSTVLKIFRALNQKVSLNLTPNSELSLDL